MLNGTQNLFSSGSFTQYPVNPTSQESMPNFEPYLQIICDGDSLIPVVQQRIPTDLQPQLPLSTISETRSIVDFRNNPSNNIVIPVSILKIVPTSSNITPHLSSLFQVDDTSNNNDMNNNINSILNFQNNQNVPYNTVTLVLPPTPTVDLSNNLSPNFYLTLPFMNLPSSCFDTSTGLGTILSNRQISNYNISTTTSTLNTQSTNNLLFSNVQTSLNENVNQSHSQTPVKIEKIHPNCNNGCNNNYSNNNISNGNSNNTNNTNNTNSTNNSNNSNHNNNNNNNNNSHYSNNIQSNNINNHNNNDSSNSNINNDNNKNENEKKDNCSNDDGINKKYKCDQCEKSFKHRSSLSVHKRLHNGAGITCQICGKVFARQSNLNEHLRVHTNERPYICSYCGKGFKQRHGLNDHLRVHTGERPYKCNTCDKAFAVKSNLVAHERLHSGEKPYQCKYCKARFHQKSSHNAHIRRVH